MDSSTHRLRMLVGSFVVLLVFSRVVAAELFINEIFFNPGGQATDTREEYVELRGTPGMSLANHYLVFLENELDEVGVGDAGMIEGIFDLGTQSLGTNGFLTLRQKSNRYAFGVAPGTTDVVNSGSGQGFGSGPGSSIGYSDDHPNGDENQGALANSGATAMIIYNHGGLVPTIGFDMDQGKDGLDSRPGSLQEPLDSWDEKWTILDSIGYFGEPTHSEFGRLYGQANFAPFDENFPFGPEWESNAIEPGADVELIPYELEYVGRLGNSTGQTTDDWHASNLTDSLGSGYIFNSYLLRQSGDPHPGNDFNPNTPPAQPSFIESNKEVPYGTILTGGLGSPNYLQGDYNKDGVVDTADYTIWRNTVGQTGSEFVAGGPNNVPNHPKADGNHDFVVNELDYAVWKSYFGAPNSNGGGGGGAFAGSVPEPSAICIVGFAVAAIASVRWRRGCQRI